MNKISKRLLLISALLLNAINLFADYSSRGRYSDFSDNGSKLDDLFIPILAIILTVVGGALIYGYITANEKDKFTKEMGGWGVACLFAGVGGLILLIKSCVG